MRRNKGQSPIQYVTVILVIVALAGSWMAYSAAGQGATESDVDKALKDTTTKSDLTKASGDIMDAIRGKEVTETDVASFLSGKDWSSAKSLLERADITVPEAGAGYESPVPWDELPKVTMRLASQDPRAKMSMAWMGAQLFKEYIENASHGNITVELHFAGELGTQTEIFEMLQRGTIQATHNGLAVCCTAYPNWTVFQSPYLFNNIEQAYYVTNPNSGLMKDLVEDYKEKVGIKIVGCTPYGFRSFTADKKLDEPSDFEGLVFRTMPTAAVKGLVDKLGGSTTTMGMGELYEALKTGAVDGHENPPWVVNAFSIQEVNDWYTLDRHALGVMVWQVNNEWLESLPPIYQRIIEHAGDIYTERAANIYRSSVKLALEKIRESEMKVYEPTPEEKTVLKNKVAAPVAKTVRNEVMDDPEVFDRLVEANLEALVELRYVEDMKEAKEMMGPEILRLAGIEE